MAALYAYFVIFLAICFAVDFSAPCRKGLSLLLLGGALASYPFLFIATHHGVVIDYPRTGSFPFYHAILEAKHIPWPRIFDDPWSVLTSTRFGSAGPLISDLSPLIRTKMPGFALMAKLLSYVVFDQRSYLFAVSSITVVSQLLIARALLKGSLRGIRWDLVALLPAAGFVIQPYGVEQLCMVYLGLCLYFLYRFNLGLTDGA